MRLFIDSRVTPS